MELLAVSGCRPVQVIGLPRCRGRTAAVYLLPRAGQCARAAAADEPTAPGSGHIAVQVFSALIELVRETGLSALIATHNMELAGRWIG